MPACNIDYLQEHGPTPREDLPDQNALENGKTKRQGGANFDLRSLSGSTFTTMPVWYLFGEHEKAAVVSAWAEANVEIVAETRAQEIGRAVRDHGRSWHAAAVDCDLLDTTDA